MAAPQPNPMAAAKPNLGGATAPQANQGNMMAALGKVKVAIEALQGALPSIPMGSPLHTEVLSAAKNLAKHLDQDEQKGPSTQDLMAMMQQAKQAAPMQALGRMQGAAPPASPAMPQGAPAMPT